MKKIIILLFSLTLLTNAYSREIITAWDDDNLFLLNDILRRLSREISPISTKNWAQNMVFSATDGDTVAWASGSFVTGDGDVFTISAGNTGDMASLTYIYIDIEASETTLQTTTDVSTAIGDNKILIAIAENNDDDATFQVMGGRGGIMISEADITVTDLSEISVDVGTITAGSITGTTIQTATGNPKIVLDPDGMTAADSLGNFVFEIETTGTDVGDVTLGQYDSNKGAKWDESEEAFMIKGVLTATSGNIGGWTINANSLSSANDQVILNNNTNNITVGDVNSTYIDITGPTPRVKSSNFVSGALGTGWQIGTNLAEFQNIYARGKITTSVFEKDTISVVGGSVLVMDGDTLNADMTAADDSTMTISGDTTFAVNDVLRIKDGTDDEWFTVTNIASAPAYTVTRDQASQYASGSNPIWKKGTSVVNFGASGEGGIYLTSSESNAPYVSVVTHAGSPWSALTARARLGNLNGYLGYGTDLYGLAIGETNKYLKYDPTNGLRIAGHTLLGSLDISTAGYIKSGQTAYNTGTGYWIEYNSGTPRLSIGDGSNYLNWTGTALQTAGLTTLGAIDISTGGYIKSGQTAYNTGTGFWIEYNSGTPRFSIGDSSTNSLTWNGTTLSIAGTLDANSGTLGALTVDGTLTIGTGGDIRSNDYVAGTTGFLLHPSTGLEVNTGTIDGDIVMANSIGNTQLKDYVAGDVLLVYADTETALDGNNSYHKEKQITVGRAGALRIKFDLDSVGGDTSYGEIRRNGGAVGSEQTTTSYATKSQDISGWTQNDTCELWIHASSTSAAKCKNFRLYVDEIPYRRCVVDDDST